MIPSQLRELCERQPGKVFRTDRDEAQRALEDLGVPLSSEFAQVYLEYCAANFVSDRSFETINDISEPTKQVKLVTDFAHNVWDLPQNLICFTSGEGEGGYLYDISTGFVWDFDLGLRDEFLAEKCQPMFKSFFAFLTWYLGGDDSPS